MQILSVCGALSVAPRVPCANYIIACGGMVAQLIILHGGNVWGWRGAVHGALVKVLIS